MEMKELREQGYTLLSQLFEKPDKKFVEAIKDQAFQDFWQQVKSKSKVEIPESWQTENIPDSEVMYDDWSKMMGPFKPLANPVESLYKPWTLDPSCKMPFAKEKGLVRGDPACHMEQLLTELGYEIPEKYAGLPDHIVMSLELMSALVESASLDVQQTFSSDHLDWLDDLIAKAKDAEAPPIYIDLYQWCRDFIKADQKYLAEQVAH